MCIRDSLNGDVIEEAAFTGHGCAVSQAAADMMADLVTGETVDEARRLSSLYLDMIKGLSLIHIFSGGEKKKLEMLQLLLLEPKLAILDETDSGLDVDALGVVSRGIDAYRRTTGGALVVITHLSLIHI